MSKDQCADCDDREVLIAGDDLKDYVVRVVGAKRECQACARSALARVAKLERLIVDSRSPCLDDDMIKAQDELARISEHIVAKGMAAARIRANGKN